MNSLDFCGTPSGAAAGAGAGYPLRTVNSTLFDFHQQMAEQYHVYSAGSPAVHTLSVAERLAGGFSPSPTRISPSYADYNIMPFSRFFHGRQKKS